MKTSIVKIFVFVFGFYFCLLIGDANSQMLPPVGSPLSRLEQIGKRPCLDCMPSAGVPVPGYKILIPGSLGTLHPAAQQSIAHGCNSSLAVIAKQDPFSPCPGVPVIQRIDKTPPSPDLNQFLQDLCKKNSDRSCIQYDPLAFFEAILITKKIITKDDEKFSCTGTLLNKNTILTAKHCTESAIDRKELKLIVHIPFEDERALTTCSNENAIHQIISACVSFIQVPVLKIVSFDQAKSFDCNKKRTYCTDIALLKIDWPEGIKQPKYPKVASHKSTANVLTMPGYGITRDQSKHQNTIDVGYQPGVKIGDSEILFKFEPDGKTSGACGGDSGAALYDKMHQFSSDQRIRVIAGVLSAGNSSKRNCDESFDIVATTLGTTTINEFFKNNQIELATEEEQYKE